MGRKSTKRSKGRMKVRNHILRRQARTLKAASWDDVNNMRRAKATGQAEQRPAPVRVRTPVRIVHRNRTPGDLLHRAKASMLAHLAMLRADSAETLEAARECARRVERWAQLRIGGAT